MEGLESRSAQEVFDDHLDLAQQGRFEEDISRNCSEGIVVLTNRGTFYGHKGVRQLAGMLQREIPDADYRYINRLVDAGSRFSNGRPTAARSRCMMARIPSSSKTARSSPKPSTTR